MGKQLLRYEAGQTAAPFQALSDLGAATAFQATFFPVSDATGSQAVVAPYGLQTGGVITPHATNDTVNIAAASLLMAGASGASASGVVSVSAGTVTISRGVSSDTHRITSITVNASGALTAVPGVDHTTFVETRGATGGPPFIPVGSVEIGQVRVMSVTAAVVTAAEIFAVAGTHTELADNPGFTLDRAKGVVTFFAALPLIHTGSLPKAVYMKGATPIFAKIQNADAWSAATETNSVSSQDTYDGAVGETSTSLTQASFTAIVSDGISEGFMQKVGQKLWFEYRPDEDKLLPKQYTQGKFAAVVSNPASGSKIATATISAEFKTTDVIA